MATGKHWSTTCILTMILICSFWWFFTVATCSLYVDHGYPSCVEAAGTQRLSWNHCSPLWFLQTWIIRLVSVGICWDDDSVRWCLADYVLRPFQDCHWRSCKMISGSQDAPPEWRSQGLRERPSGRRSCKPQRRHVSSMLPEPLRTYDMRTCCDNMISYYCHG